MKKQKRYSLPTRIKQAETWEQFIASIDKCLAAGKKNRATYEQPVIAEQKPKRKRRLKSLHKEKQ